MDKLGLWIITGIVIWDYAVKRTVSIQLTDGSK